MDYRFLLESTFVEQKSDVASMEGFLRTRLEDLLDREGTELKINGSKVIVAGASAGAHLALLTPTLWTTPPNAILSLYGPTNFHDIPWLDRKFNDLPPYSSTILMDATTYENPPTIWPREEDSPEQRQARKIMGQHIYRSEVLAAFLHQKLDFRTSRNCNERRDSEEHRGVTPPEKRGSYRH